MPLDPVWLKVMDVGKFIREQHCLPVTSVFIRTSTTKEFAPDGLFSEVIFGQVNTPERLIKFGYIDLRTKIIHPTIYRNILKLKKFYDEIMSRQAYAIFDPETKELVKADPEEEGAATGYQFFLKVLPQLSWATNDSQAHNEKVKLMEQCQNNLFLEQCLVLPAGLRDLRQDEAKPAADSINKLYASLINYTLALPTTKSDNDIYDNVRYSIQRKVGEIYQYLFDMIGGKMGFFQRRYGSRSLALGTRNVISSASMAAKSPDDPKYLKMDEIKVPLFQGSKMFLPLVIYNLKMLFFNEIFSTSADQVAVIDPKTNQLIYQPLDESEKAKFLASDGINKIIDLFRDPEYRYTAVSVYNDKGKAYYLYLVYDEGQTIYLTRSVTELPLKLKERGVHYDPTKLRPLTYAEMLYIATYRATLDKHAIVTRYPAIEVGSTVPNRVHLMTTNPGRTVHVFTSNELDEVLTLPEYPILNGQFTDSTVVHPQLYKGLSADTDGNCLVGSTRVTLRYTAEWLIALSELDYTASGQVWSTLSEQLKSVSRLEGTDYYAVIRMDQFPQPGAYRLDRNQAKMYTIPPGCAILSLKAGSYSFEPITQITVESDCPTVKVLVGDRSIQPSTNESLAVFNHALGGLTRVAPEVATPVYIPCLVQDPTPFGSEEVEWELPLTAAQIALIPTLLLNGSKTSLWRSWVKLVDRFGSIQLRSELTQFSYKLQLQEIDTSLKSLILQLCYRLGLRFKVLLPDPRDTRQLEQLLYTIELHPLDVQRHLMQGDIEFKALNPDLVKAFTQWKADPIGYYLDESDVIPVTFKERAELQAVVTKLDDVELEQYLNQPLKAYLRSRLVKCLPYLQSEPLKLRISNPEVVWYQPQLTEVEQTTTVYDFEIPTTKVFAVNEGVIVYDTVSLNGILSKQANAELEQHLNSVGRFVGTNGKLTHGTTDLINLTLFNLSRDPDTDLAQ